MRCACSGRRKRWPSSPTLGRWLEAEVRPIREVTKVFRGAGTGLAVAHEREHPSYPALFEIEEAVGGTAIADPSGDTVFGTFQLLRDQLPISRPGWAVQAWDEATLVWVGATSATVLYATGEGAIIEADFHSGHVVPTAESIDNWLARASVADLDDRAGRTAFHSVEGRLGTRLADALGIEIDPAYSDRFHTRWAGDDYAVLETVYPYDGQPWTTIATRSDASLQRALDRVR